MIPSIPSSRQDSVGLVRSLYANLSYENLNLSVPAETNRSDNSYWLVPGR
jgi:hypothetical protein